MKPQRRGVCERLWTLEKAGATTYADLQDDACGVDLRVYHNDSLMLELQTPNASAAIREAVELCRRLHSLGWLPTESEPESQQSSHD